MGRNIFLRSRVLVYLSICLSVFALVQLFLLWSSAGSDPTYASACQSIGKIMAALARRVEDGSSELSNMLKRLDNQTLISSTPSSQDAIPLRNLSSFEVIRRRAVHYARELWYLAAAKLDSIKTGTVSPPDVASFRELLEELTRLLQVDLLGLGRVDGLAEQTVNELERLSRVVRQRIDQIQNPSNCAEAKILVAELDRPCGFGCNLHHLAYCFQLAYFSGRTLLLGAVNHPFSSWWAEHFLPLSATCSASSTSVNGAPSFNGNPSQNSARVLHCPYIGHISNFKWLPPAIPDNLAQDLSTVHGSPFVWFIGQLTAYLMRPAPSFEATLNSSLAQYGLLGNRSSPMVGIHVRRTDKVGVEAAFHDISEYMVHVNRQFQVWDTQKLMHSRSHEWKRDSLSEKLLSGNIKRQAFIATDEPSVLKDAQTKYPDYVFYADSNRAQTASVGQRHLSDSITGIATDIIILSRTDYLVCTFSSQVCRAAYELMQTRHAELGDASDLAQSLDDGYYFGGNQAIPYEAIVSDTASKAKPGDRYHFDGNHWNGYALVHNVNGDGKRILAPAYKFRPRVLAVPMN